MDFSALVSTLIETTLGFFLKLVLGVLTDLFFGGEQTESLL